jgi:hypothetical protein
VTPTRVLKRVKLIRYTITRKRRRVDGVGHRVSFRARTYYVSYYTNHYSLYPDSGPEPLRPESETVVTAYVSAVNGCAVGDCIL